MEWPRRERQNRDHHLDKVLYPGGRFTEAQVADYYARISRFLLPHFRNRPVTLNVTRRAIRAPKFIFPMKATPVEQLPEGGAWPYEIKWDACRAIALKRGENIRLLSLKEKSLAADFPAVAETRAS